mmetsp:Transcript_4555/g.6948  ORF Transcript_4555/g.6948 Transcript_4555/m.6948 type:complete len:189 (-) Transcript_4555:245-811(-)|eukprot:CAMPEP_0196804588 /NCGR_PEP_ID=MMETSP1362-20130617/4215_1 /TAXON_ID=163516 /ORGANISM="Leptocylindrus danicus, Strain CCMP1856" /LENGTH=188 /DNA_ID=CAMNT_0042176991 /DNA_START=744 /DNA_END=1310 /DNA_ORIENTATION=+
MKTSITIAVFLFGLVACATASNGAIRATKEKQGGKLEGHHYNDGGNMTQADDILDDSIYVPDEFVDEFEDMVVEPFNEDEMDFDYDEFDEDDRRALYRKRKYKVLYCYKYKKGGKYYRKLEISQDDIDQSEDITTDEERDLVRAYEGKRSGHKYKERCFGWRRHICCYKKHHHKRYKYGYKEDEGYRF